MKVAASWTVRHRAEVVKTKTCRRSRRAYTGAAEKAVRSK